MQSQTKSPAAVPGSETRIEVRTPTGRWQQPEAVRLQPAPAPRQPVNYFDNIILPERGVPFSPLND